MIEIVTGEESHEAISLEELNETIASGEIVNANESTFMARNEIATQSKTTNRNDDDLITDDESDTLNETVKSKRITILIRTRAKIDENATRPTTTSMSSAEATDVLSMHSAYIVDEPESYSQAVGGEHILISGNDRYEREISFIDQKQNLDTC